MDVALKAVLSAQNAKTRKEYFIRRTQRTPKIKLSRKRKERKKASERQSATFAVADFKFSLNICFYTISFSPLLPHFALHSPIAP
jgi:hypothetical protein